ncbi:hypothetical protein KAT08_04350 [Candidatus Babeliales bacterium]|nr:hypothetical protein [Candidatus Babeliales bacterium]
MVGSLKKIKFLKLKSFIIATSLLFVTQFSTHSLYSKIEHIPTQIINIIKGPYHNPSIDLPIKTDQFNSPTLNYLKIDKIFKENVETNYDHKINLIGKDFFEKLFNDTIEKEIEYSDTHYTLYHGQKREFLLLQDMAENLYQIVLKKTLKDFIFLRIPDKDFKKIKSVKEFLKKSKKEMENNWNFDDQKHINKILLAVNPSLFGNNIFQGGECTFSFFINSENINYIDQIDLMEKLFKFFKISSLFKKYKENLQELVDLLSYYEPNKTGILLQILIPKKYIDNIAYRCKPFGITYHTDPIKTPASYDLEKYQKNNFSLFTSHYSIDQMQLRLLINQHFLLNPDQPSSPSERILFFRYLNETEKIKTYKEKLKNVLKKIKNDIKENNFYGEKNLFSLLYEKIKNLILIK